MPVEAENLDDGSVGEGPQTGSARCDVETVRRAERCGGGASDADEGETVAYLLFVMGSWVGLRLLLLFVAWWAYRGLRTSTERAFLSLRVLVWCCSPSS